MQLVLNKGYCPNCGEDLESLHRHHYVSCGCGKSALDGGLDYIRVIGDAISVPVYDNDPYPRVRQSMYRAGRGKDGRGEFRYTRLAKMSDSYLDSLLEYEGTPPWQMELVRKEQYFRKTNNITIND